MNSAVSLKRTLLLETERKSSLVYMGEDHGRCNELGAASKNPPV